MKSNEYINFLKSVAIQGGAQGLAAQEVIEAIQKREYERDDHGRFASTGGGSNESSGSDSRYSAIDRAERAAERAINSRTTDTHERAAEAHRAAAEYHKNAAKNETNGDMRDLHIRAASAHNEAAKAHDEAAFAQGNNAKDADTYSQDAAKKSDAALEASSYAQESGPFLEDGKATNGTEKAVDDQSAENAKANSRSEEMSGDRGASADARLEAIQAHLNAAEGTYSTAVAAAEAGNAEGLQYMKDDMETHLSHAEDHLSALDDISNLDSAVFSEADDAVNRISELQSDIEDLKP